MSLHLFNYQNKIHFSTKTNIEISTLLDISKETVLNKKAWMIGINTPISSKPFLWLLYHHFRTSRYQAIVEIS